MKTGERAALTIFEVRLTKQALKDLDRVPLHIGDHLTAWIASIRKQGLELVRKIPGYHDEPLKGKRVGQRSIRLSRGYRAFYIIKKDNSIEFVSIEEVNKHQY